MASLTRIQGYAHIAGRYGLEEAIFLDTIVHWYRVNRADNRNFREGRWWTYNTVKAFDQAFPWWTSKQIRRIITSCKEQGALLTGNFNEDSRDRTIWYSPGDELLMLYGDDTGKCIFPNGQMEVTEQADKIAQTGKALPCNTRVETNRDSPYSPPQGETAQRRATGKSEPYRLDWFEAFWKKYPRRDNKQAALRAWCKLKPDRPLCVVMAAALARDKRSKQWTKDGGEYIPLASTWINQRRWENEGVDLSQLPAASDSGGWAPDPEVT